MSGISITSIKPGSLDWAQSVRLFFLRCRSQNLAQPTLDLYAVRLEIFTKWATAQGINPADVQTSHLRAYLDHCRERGNKPSTIEAVYRNLRTFFGFMFRDGLLLTNPTERLERPVREKRIPRSFNEDELRKVLEQIKTNTALGARDYSLILLVADSGLRLSEALNLKGKDVDWAGRTVTVIGKRRERRVPFGERAHNAISVWVRRRGGMEADAPLFIDRFGRPIKRTHFAHRLKAYTKRAGIADFRLSSHGLRHFMALAFLRSGGNALALQRLLGHENLSMTQKYAALIDDDAIKEHRLASPLDRMGPLPNEKLRARVR